MSFPNSIVSKHLDDILADYKSHMLLEQYQSMSATSQQSYVDGYMIWFYSVSHSVMTSDAHGPPHMPAHEKILENEQVKDDHVIYVLLSCQNIMWITYEGIKSGLFERGNDDAVVPTCSILTEAQNALPTIEEEPGGQNQAYTIGYAFICILGCFSFFPILLEQCL